MTGLSYESRRITMAVESVVMMTVKVRDGSMVVRWSIYRPLGKHIAGINIHVNCSV